MPTKSPQVTQTSKIESLPDDLKEIAQGLINDKFGEEVVEQRKQPRQSFRGPDGIHAGPPAGYDTSIYDTSYDGRRLSGRIEAMYDAWSGNKTARIRVNYPSIDCIRDAVRTLDMELPGRAEKRIIAGTSFLSALCRDAEFNMYARRVDRLSSREGMENMVYELHGMPVIISPNPATNRDCYIEQRL